MRGARERVARVCFRSRSTCNRRRLCRAIVLGLLVIALRRCSGDLLVRRGLFPSLAGRTSLVFLLAAAAVD